MPSLYLASIASRVAAFSICLHLWIFSQCSHKKPIKSSLPIGLYLFSPKKAFFLPKTCSDNLWSLSTVCKLSKSTGLLPCLPNTSLLKKIVSVIKPYRVTPGVFLLDIFSVFCERKIAVQSPQKILSSPIKNLLNLCRKKWGNLSRNYSTVYGASTRWLVARHLLRISRLRWPRENIPGSRSPLELRWILAKIRLSLRERSILWIGSRRFLPTGRILRVGMGGTRGSRKAKPVIIRLRCTSKFSKSRLRKV